MSAAVATTDVYHFTKREIKSWGDFDAQNIKSRHKIGLSGKPIGFWYAYASSWRTALAGMSGAPANVARFKYKLPLHGFTEDPASDSPTMILRLSQANLKTFLQTFHKPEFFVDPKGLLKSLTEEYIMSGDSDLTLFMDHEAIMEYVKGKIGDPDMEDDDVDPDDLANHMMKFWNRKSAETLASIVGEIITKSLSNRDYAMFPVKYYKWHKFWENVSQKFAGVEFTEDVVYPRRGDRIFIEFDTGRADLPYATGLDVSWLRLLDVVSGCIFDPKIYFDERPPTNFKNDTRTPPRSRSRSRSRSPTRSSKGNGAGGSAAAGTARRGGTRKFRKNRK
jgi:hypothetical protein